MTMMVEWQGKQVPLAELCDRFGADYDCVRKRIGRYGWPLEKALTTPVGPHGGDYKLPEHQRAHNRNRSTSGRMAAE
jgi:hypothetical protein